MNYPTQAPHCVRPEGGTGWGSGWNIEETDSITPCSPTSAGKWFGPVAAFLGSQNSLRHASHA